MIIHYFQPHAPYIGETKLLGYTDTLPFAHFDNQEASPPCRPIWEGVRSGTLDGDLVKRAYRDNLRLVLSEARKLVDAIPKVPAFITSDHGELLGEDGLWGHHEFDHKKIREVPWFQVIG